MTESNNCDRKDILSKKIVSVTHRSFCDRNKQVSVTERSFCHRKKILTQKRFTVTDRSFCDRMEFVLSYACQGLLLPALFVANSGETNLCTFTEDFKKQKNVITDENYFVEQLNGEVPF